MRIENRSQNTDLVFVLSKQGKALMPCKPARARKLLSSGKAKVVRRTPFTIQLLFGSTGYIQDCEGGVDTGSKRAGFAVKSNGQVIYQSVIELRNDVHSKMDQRKIYRRNRRSRKTRYRPARFDNRGKKGSLAPSVRSKIQSHLREKNFIERILPISHWKVELARFDIHKISDLNVSKQNGWSYQNGNQKDFYNVKAYILSRDEYTCQQCKKMDIPFHVHHIVFRSEGGTNSPDNLTTLCHQCHEKLHQGELGDQVHEKLKKKTRSKTKHATEMGILQSQLRRSGWIFEESFGYETKFKREQYLNLPKTHIFDAVAVCTREGESVEICPQFYFKKHVSKGDYRQTQGPRSEKKIPTGKLFGLRKFDLIQTSQGVGLIKGKRSSGYFSICKLDGTKIHDSVNVKKGFKRLQARSTTLIEKGNTRHLLGLKAKVSAA